MNGQYRIDYTPKFAKQFRQLPQSIKNKAERKEQLLRTDPFSASLKTHKLRGELSDYWSCSIDCHYRIIFRLISNRRILLVTVGIHSVYQ